MNDFSYNKPGSIPEAITALQEFKGYKAIAGGTNIIDLMKYCVTSSDGLIDISGIQEHQTIHELPNSGIRLGAFATNADTAYHPIVESRYPLLSKAILAGASAQIRNMATNGGNLLQRTRCYYFYDVNTSCNKREPGSGCSALGGYNRNMAIMGTSEHCIAVFPSDMCVALAALDAVVNIAGPAGKRKVPLVDFHRLPGDTPHVDNKLMENELITAIDLPAKGFADNFSYLKIRDRNSYAFALVSVATGLELNQGIIQDARIALGGIAHKPWRVVEAEEYLRGKSASRNSFKAAASIILDGAKSFEHNAFKVELARRAIVRNCLMALEPHRQLPGGQPSL